MSIRRQQSFQLQTVGLRAVALVASVTLLLPGCGGGRTTATTGEQTGTLNFKGTITGVVSQSRSTRESLDAVDAAAQQTLPLEIIEVDSSRATVTFEDLDGNPLLTARGTSLPPGSIRDSGSFEGSNLPVGIDFVVAVDLDGDGEPDIRHVVQIPADATGNAGRLDDVVVDPLTTLVVAKLRDLLAEAGVSEGDIEVSLTAIAQRLVDAFVHLFEESGIDQNLTLDDIASLTDANVDDLFDTLVPPIVRTGINTLRGTLALGKAGVVADGVKAAAEIFLRAGFPIADEPEGIDLSFLGDLPDVEILSIDSFAPPDDQVVRVAQFEDLGLTADQIDTLLADGTVDALLADGSVDALLADGTIDDVLGEGTIDQLLADGTIDSLLADGAIDLGFDGPRPTIYVSTVSEPDRNFIANDEFDPEGKGPHLPILKERILTRLARLHLEGRTITLGNLYRLLTDAEVGFGARLTYFAPGPDQDGPPPMTFETADGTGIARNVEQLIFDLLSTGALDPSADFDTLLAQETVIRDKMRELLAGTVPPSMERLFGVLLSDRIESADQLFSFIRESRSHLPFSRSGPSTFFVIADGDAFRPDAGVVNPMSVDVEFDADGFPVRVVHNPSSTGTFFLGFTFDTEINNVVELLVRETGRWLHGPRGGRILLNMGDANLFESINGVPFADFVAEEGTFWPGVSVAVANPEFLLDATIDGGLDGPTRQLFVLASRPGPDAVPVRINFDLSTGTFFSSPTGRYYMMFMEETRDQGLFGLYDIELGFMVSVDDLTGTRFVEEILPPPPPPDDGIIIVDGTVDGTLVDEPLAGTTDATTTATVDEPPAAQTEPTTTDGTTTDGTQTIIEEAPLEPMPFFEFVAKLVSPGEVVALTVQPEFFRFVFGTEVPNENFDASGNPFFDDVNGNGIEDADEFTADFRPILFNPDDWRSTDVSRYYRRESGGAVVAQEIDFESDVPRALDGALLVARNFLPRLNAFKFGRPNTAINLLTTFARPEFFNGTQAMTPDTRLSILEAISIINLVMEQVFNVEALVDIDGPGPFRTQRILTDAQLFVVPIGDPMMLLVKGFETLSEARSE